MTRRDMHEATLMPRTASLSPEVRASVELTYTQLVVDLDPRRAMKETASRLAVSQRAVERVILGRTRPGGGRRR